MINHLWPGTLATHVFAVFPVILGGSFANMLGMHLARLKIDPDIKFAGMGSHGKLVIFASTEVSIKKKVRYVTSFNFNGNRHRCSQMSPFSKWYDFV